MYQYRRVQPIVVGWSVPDDISTGYINPFNYSDPDIICHWNATSAPISAPVWAGGVVELQWTKWPGGHHGPVIDYLARCPGDCAHVDKSKLKFFKIGEAGLLRTPSQPPGYWASDQLLSNNNSWSVIIPRDIAPGNYVLRHEIIALHSAGELDGAQNYPQCINIEVSSQGDDEPAGVLGTELYRSDDPGISINIYKTLSSYNIPGPSVYESADRVSQTVAAIEAYASVESSSSLLHIATSASMSRSSRTSVAATRTRSATASDMQLSQATPYLATPSTSYDVVLVTEFVTVTRGSC